MSLVVCWHPTNKTNTGQITSHKNMTHDTRFRSIQPLLILFGSNLLGAIVGGIFFLFASWDFDLEGIGLYAVAINTQWIVVGLVGTGLSVATIRLSTDFLVTGKREAAGGVVLLSVLISIGICLFGAVIGGVITLFPAKSFLLPGGFMVLIALWAGARSALDCLRSGLLAQQQYNRVGLLMVLSTIVGLVSLVIVLLSGSLTLKRLLIAHVITMGISVAVGVGFLWPLWRTGIYISKQLLQQLLKYARWPAFSQGIRLFQTHVGPFVLFAVSGADQAGLFSLGRYPAYIFGVVVLSLYQYWLPEAAREEAHDQLMPFLGRQIRLAVTIGSGMLLIALAVHPLIPRLGANFADAAPLFLLNSLDFVIFVLIIPIETAYHALLKPHLELVVRSSTLPLLLILSFLLASRFGATGMVWAHILSNVAALGVAGWLLRMQLGTDTVA
jgi:O-antigen/teichoic acid export membrane protein